MFDSDAQNSKYSSHDTRFQSSFAILSLPSVSPIAWTSRNALNGTMTFLRASIETSMVWCEPWINDIWLRSISDVAPKLWQPMSVCRWTDTQTTIADCLTLGVGGGVSGVQARIYLQLCLHGFQLSLWINLLKFLPPHCISLFIFGSFLKSVRLFCFTSLILLFLRNSSVLASSLLLSIRLCLSFLSFVLYLLVFYLICPHLFPILQS